MFTYIDESGLFIPGRGKWSAVAAYCIAESDRRRMQLACEKLRNNIGIASNEEIKAKNLWGNQQAYFEFLRGLQSSRSFLVTAFTHSTFQSHDIVIDHRSAQAKLIVAKPHHEISKQHELETWEKRFSTLSPQLYLQVLCQIRIFDEVIRTACMHFSLCAPPALKNFRWIMDEKGKRFNDEMLDLIGPALRYLAQNTPLEIRQDGDFRFMQDMMINKAQLQETPLHTKGPKGLVLSHGAVDIAKLVKNNWRFVDSKSTLGIQVADLLAGGVTHLLNGSFDDEEQAAVLIGKLMISRNFNHDPAYMAGFRNDSLNETQIPNSKLISLMNKSSRNR